MKSPSLESKFQPIFPPADRIASFKPYYFASLNRKIDQLKSQGQDVIRIDIGSPDLPPADFIIDAMVESSRNGTHHGYGPNGGPIKFKEAVSQYYSRRFNVDLDPSSQVLGLIGSKEGLFHLSQVLINPGDVVLVPDPGYPVYKASGVIAGAEIYPLPLNIDNHFLPDLDSIPEDIARRSKILWLNYPNNPTGAVADLEFFQKAVDFGRKYNCLVAHDAPYTDVCFNDYKAPSILEIQGAEEVCIEFNSLSKTYNMAGWRVGMAVGNAKVINYMHTYKSQLDTSQFTPIFDAGVSALTQDQTWLVERNLIYQQRRDIILKAIREAGFVAETPPAAIYIWAKLPHGMHDSMSICSQLLDQAGLSITPGIIYGDHGEGFVRLSLCTPADRLKVAMDRLIEWVNYQKN